MNYHATVHVGTTNYAQQPQKGGFPLFSLATGALAALFFGGVAVDAVSGATPGSLAHVLHQGESKARGYDDGNNCPSRSRCYAMPSDVKPTELTVGQILEMQERRGSTGGIFAVGFYQVVPVVLQEVVRVGVIKQNERFTPHVQDRMFTGYLAATKRPAIQKAIRNGFGYEDAAHAAACEWAALISPKLGRGVHDNRGKNKGVIPAQAVIKALKQAHRQYVQALDMGLDPDTAYAVALGVKQVGKGSV